MPITPFLTDEQFDRETTRLMAVAFESARVAIARDWSNYADATIAKHIVELAKAGERKALKMLRTKPPIWG
jgi:hypothetical protein